MGLRTAAAVGVIAALALAPSALAAQHGPIAGKHQLSKGLSQSSNWSGYDATGTGATHVIGTWTQPSATCGARETSWSSPWVGIDGDTSSTVEQIGTDSDCNRGQPFYYAWYEMYPKSLVQIPTVGVHPGDSYTGEVTAGAGSTYTLRLTDNTTGDTFTTTQSGGNTANASVEWIMEGPSNGTLTNFGTVPFTNGSASINGQTNASIATLRNLSAITMVGKKNLVRAQPNSLSRGSFSVTWLHG